MQYLRGASHYANTLVGQASRVWVQVQGGQDVHPQENNISAKVDANPCEPLARLYNFKQYLCRNWLFSVFHFAFQH